MVFERNSKISRMGACVKRYNSPRKLSGDCLETAALATDEGSVASEALGTDINLIGRP